MASPTKEALVRFYEKHNPAHVDKIDSILTQYQGRAEDLRERLRKKYGEEIEHPIQGEWSLHWSQTERKQYWFNSTTEEKCSCDKSLPKDWVCGEREGVAVYINVKTGETMNDRPTLGSQRKDQVLDIPAKPLSNPNPEPPQTLRRKSALALSSSPSKQGALLENLWWLSGAPLVMSLSAGRIGRSGSTSLSIDEAKAQAEIAVAAAAVVAAAAAAAQVPCNTAMNPENKEPLEPAVAARRSMSQLFGSSAQITVSCSTTKLGLRLSHYPSKVPWAPAVLSTELKASQLKVHGGSLEIVSNGGLLSKESDGQGSSSTSEGGGTALELDSSAAEKGGQRDQTRELVERQTAQLRRVVEGSVLTRVAGRSVLTGKFEDIVQRIKSAPRPVTLTFMCPIRDETEEVEIDGGDEEEEEKKKKRRRRRRRRRVQGCRGGADGAEDEAGDVAKEEEEEEEEEEGELEGEDEESAEEEDIDLQPGVHHFHPGLSCFVIGGLDAKGGGGSEIVAEVVRRILRGSASKRQMLAVARVWLATKCRRTRKVKDGSAAKLIRSLLRLLQPLGSMIVQEGLPAVQAMWPSWMQQRLMEQQVQKEEEEEQEQEQEQRGGGEGEEANGGDSAEKEEASEAASAVEVSDEERESLEEVGVQLELELQQEKMQRRRKEVEELAASCVLSDEEIKREIQSQLLELVLLPCGGYLLDVFEREEEAAGRAQKVGANLPLALLEAYKEAPQSVKDNLVRQQSETEDVVEQHAGMRWGEAVALLQTMQAPSAHTLRGATSGLLRCKDSIFAEMAVLNDEENKLSGKSGGKNIGMDDFLPIFLHVLARSSVRCPGAAAAFMRALMPEHQARLEAGFFLTTFEAALSYVEFYGEELEDEREQWREEEMEKEREKEKAKERAKTAAEAKAKNEGQDAGQEDAQGGDASGDAQDKRKRIGKFLADKEAQAQEVLQRQMSDESDRGGPGGRTTLMGWMMGGEDERKKRRRRRRKEKRRRERREKSERIALLASQEGDGSVQSPPLSPVLSATDSVSADGAGGDGNGGHEDEDEDEGLDGVIGEDEDEEEDDGEEKDTAWFGLWGYSIKAETDSDYETDSEDDTTDDGDDGGDSDGADGAAGEVVTPAATLAAAPPPPPSRQESNEDDYSGGGGFHAAYGGYQRAHPEMGDDVDQALDIDSMGELSSDTQPAAGEHKDAKKTFIDIDTLAPEDE
jgi:hypothetical protein